MNDELLFISFQQGQYPIYDKEYGGFLGYLFHGNSIRYPPKNLEDLSDKFNYIRISNLLPKIVFCLGKVGLYFEDLEECKERGQGFIELGLSVSEPTSIYWRNEPWPLTPKRLAQIERMAILYSEMQRLPKKKSAEFWSLAYAIGEIRSFMELLPPSSPPNGKYLFLDPVPRSRINREAARAYKPGKSDLSELLTKEQVLQLKSLGLTRGESFVLLRKNKWNDFAEDVQKFKSYYSATLSIPDTIS